MVGTWQLLWVRLYRVQNNQTLLCCGIPGEVNLVWYSFSLEKGGKSVIAISHIF